MDSSIAGNLEKVSLEDSNADETRSVQDETVEKYLSFLNEKWQKFARLLIESTMGGVKYQGIKGTEVVHLPRRATVLSESNSFVVYKDRHVKRGEEIVNVLLCHALPQMVIRLVIKPGGGMTIGADNRLADDAVECFYEQMKVCWKVVPDLLCWNNHEFFYAREFEKVTCLLHIGGKPTGLSLADTHLKPMQDKLHRLGHRNMDPLAYDLNRDLMPSLNLNKMNSLVIPKDFKDYCCCQKKTGDKEMKRNEMKVLSFCIEEVLCELDSVAEKL